MQKKIVGFTIEIDGKQELVKTEKILKLINKDLVKLNQNLLRLDKTAGKGFGKLNSALIKTTSSSSKLGATIESAFVSFKDGGELVKKTGTQFTKLTKEIEKTAKASKKKAKEEKAATVTDAQRIKQLSSILNLTREEDKELKGLLKTRAKLRNAAKERNDIAKQEAIIAAERKGTRKALKAELALITIELNKKTEAEQLSTRAGRKLTAQQLKLNKTLFELESKGGTFSRRVGEYARGLVRVDKAAIQAGKTLKKLTFRLTVGRSLIEGFSNGVRSAAQGLRQLVEDGDGSNEVFNKLEDSGKGLEATLNRVGTEFLGAFGSGIAKIIDNVSFVISVVSEALIEASESTGFFGDILRGVGEILTNFPAIFGGIVAAAKQFATNTKTAFVDFSIQAQIAGEEFLKFGKSIAGFDTSANEKEINRLTNALKRNAFAAKSVGDAYTEGYNETIAAQEEFNKQSEKDVENLEKQRVAVKRRNEARKEADKAEKKRIEGERRAIEQLNKDRQELLNTLNQEAAARVEIARDLQAQLVDIRIESIKDESKRATEEEKVRFEREKEAREVSLKALQDQAAAQEAETLRLFGENSEELKALEAQNDKDLLDLSKTNDEIAEAQEQAHKDKLIAIQKTSSDAAAEAQAEIDAKALEDQKAANEKKEQEDKESEQKRLETKKANVNAAVDIFNTGFDLIEKLSSIGAKAEQDRFNQAIEARRKNLESLSEDLQGATGLQKQFLEQQVKQEKEALEQEEKNREKAEKERVKAAQALALVQVAINGAIAITRAFSDLGPIAGAVAAVGVGAAIIAQVAEISSQKFAKGGVIDGASHSEGGVKVFGGRVELEGQEGIINKDSMKNPLLRSIASFVNEAGGGNKFSNTRRLGSFATGGIVGAPSVAPNVSSSSDRIIAAMDAKTDAINNRIDNINVALDVNNFQDFEDNEAKQVALTTLG